MEKGSRASDQGESDSGEGRALLVKWEMGHSGVTVPRQGSRVVKKETYATESPFVSS